MKALIGIVVLAVVVAGLYFLNDFTRTEDGKSVLNVAGEEEILVDVVQPELRAIYRIVQAPGNVEPFLEVDISAEVVGKIEEMPVDEGDVVTKGQLLCRLDDVDYRARLISAQANVAKLEASVIQAEADVEKAERDMQRQVLLSEAEATSSIELADYRTAFVQAQARLEMRKQELVEAEAMVQSAQEDLEKTVITAPMDGIVSQRFAKAGEVVVTGTMNNPGTRIMVISDLSKMQVRCRVDESDAPLVKPGQDAAIYLQSDALATVEGTVRRIATKGTKVTGRDVVTFETLILVDPHQGKVKPGMTASVEIEVARSENALTIPVQAVVSRKRRDLPEVLVQEFNEMRVRLAEASRIREAEYIPVVFCNDGLEAKPRVIETGISDESGVEILAGLSAEDSVIVGPYRSLDQLKHGSKLKLEDEEKSDAEEASEGDEAKSESEEDSTILAREDSPS